MQRDGAERQSETLLHEHGDHFAGEAGERGECSQEAGDHQQAPRGIDVGAAGEHRERDADAVAADEVHGQRAPGDQTARVEPEREAPAHQGADAGSQADDGDIEQHAPEYVRTRGHP